MMMAQLLDSLYFIIIIIIVPLFINLIPRLRRYWVLRDATFGCLSIWTLLLKIFISGTKDLYSAFFL